MLVCMAPVTAAFGGLAEGIDAFNAMDYPIAIEELSPLVAAGDMQATYYLACIRNPYFERIYSEEFVDVEAAYRLYGTAAAAGDPYAKYQLIRMRRLGWRNKNDRGHRYYRVVADAYVRLRERAEDGDGIAALMASAIPEHGAWQMLALSRKLLEGDARRGDATAQWHLAEAYLHSYDLNVRSNPLRAFAWATVAVRNGNRHALIQQRMAALWLRETEYRQAEELAGRLIEDPAAPYPDAGRH